MINLSCGACLEMKPLTNLIGRSTDQIDKLQKHFVCGDCLFTLPLPDADEMIELIPDQVIDSVPTIPAMPEKKITRNVAGRDTSKMRLPELFKLGRIKRHDRLHIEGKIGSHASVICARSICLDSDGSIMTWNAYGQRFTGHVAVNIYKHIEVNGTLLESLRY